MSEQHNPALDPKLQHLVEKIGDRSRLEDEVVNSRVRQTEPGAATASALTVDVLVKVDGEAPVTAIPDSTWTRLVDGIHAVTLPITALEDLADLSEVQYVEAASLLSPQLSTSLARTGADQLHSPSGPRPALTGKGVVVGIVDDGLDFTLDDFISLDGTTRVAFLWDQSLTPQDNEHSPADFGFGVEYDADAIDDALKAADPFGRVRHRPRHGSHGTHVAGIAAGNGRSTDAQFAAGQFVGAAPQATIVFVQPDRTGETDTFADSVNTARAITYVYAKASELGMPCVINMSLSQNGGSHDGTTLVEQTIDRLLETRGRAFVHAAGNGHIWRNHASGVLAAGEVRRLGWRSGGGLPLPSGTELPVGPDQTPNELEIWYSPRDEFHVRLIHPGGEATPAVRPGEAPPTHQFADGTTGWISSQRFSPQNGDARIRIEVERGSADAVTDGVWQVQIEAVAVRDGAFHSWVERDVRNPAFHQSFFVGTDFDPVMTLGTPATTRRGISVANYSHLTLGLERSSSRGRTRDGRDKPELAAPGTGIVASHALGGRPHPETGEILPMRFAQTGTSMSAPHVAGIAALLLEHRPELTAEQLRKALLASANPPEGVSVFDDGWGYGRVDAVEALRLLS